MVHKDAVFHLYNAVIRLGLLSLIPMADTIHTQCYQEKQHEMSSTDVEDKEPQTGTMTPEKEEQPTFPDGGLRAWLVVLGAFFLMFSTFGYISTFA